MKRISIDGLTNVLSPKEMKNVTGGSGDGKCCYSKSLDDYTTYPCDDANACSTWPWWCCNCAYCG